jgi:hypothetical protein
MVIWIRRGVLRTTVQGGIVAGQSVAHHHHHSTWARTELLQVYRDIGMMETDSATGEYGDTGVAEIDGGMGCFYLGDPKVDSFHRSLYLILDHLISSHLIIKLITHSIFRIF